MIVELIDFPTAYKIFLVFIPLLCIRDLQRRWHHSLVELSTNNMETLLVGQINRESERTRCIIHGLTGTAIYEATDCPPMRI